MNKVWLGSIFPDYKKQPPEKYDYQRDVPWSKGDSDKFDHFHYVSVLKDILLKSKPPINIGLYGRWGVGKSSILNMLKEEIKNDSELSNFKYVDVDAWGLSGNTLQQEILTAINEKIDPRSTPDIENTLYTMTEETTVNTKKYFMRIGLPVIIFTSIALAVAAILNHYNIEIPLTTNTVITAGIAILGSGITIVSLLMKYAIGQSKRIIPRAASSLKFKEIYKKMVEKVNKNLVVVIDNLDRCDDKVAVDLLGIIQTFMTRPKCINILACDDVAIINHLRNVKGEYYTPREGNEFLSKFFQVTLVIPPFIGENLENYAEELISQRSIDLHHDAKSVLISGAVQNPRKINQFLNNVVAMYRLAEKKEEKSKHIPLGSITKRTDFLTKMIILRHEWPIFYRLLETDPELLEKIPESLDLEQIKKIMPTKDEDVVSEVLEEFTERGLGDFLISTQSCIVPDVRPFVKLNHKSFEGSIPDKDRFVLFVENGRVPQVLDLLNKADDKGKIDYIKKIIALNVDLSEADRIVGLVNSTKVLISTIDLITNLSLKSDAYRCLGKYLRRTLQEHYKRYDQDQLFEIIKQTHEFYRVSIYGIFKDLIQKDKEPNEEIINRLLNDNKSIPEIVLKDIGKEIATLIVDHEDLILNILEPVLDSPDWINNNFSHPIEFITFFISQITCDDSPLDNRRIEIIMKVQKNLHDSEKQRFVNHLQIPINTASDASAPVPARTLKAITDLVDLEMTGVDNGMDRLFESLITAAEKVPQPPQKQEIFEVLLYWMGKSGGKN